MFPRTQNILQFWLLEVINFLKTVLELSSWSIIYLMVFGCQTRLTVSVFYLSIRTTGNGLVKKRCIYLSIFKARYSGEFLCWLSTWASSLIYLFPLGNQYPLFPFISFSFWLFIYLFYIYFLFIYISFKF